MPVAAARPPYEVLRHDNAAHAVRHPALGIMAFVLFEPTPDWVADTLKSDTPAVVLIEQHSKTMRIAVANPDLNFPASETIDDLKSGQSQPTRITLTLRGRWRLAGGVDAVRLSETGGDTALTVTCRDGATVEFNLGKDSR
jgi:chondroitin-sulfate-ABC endolyase/exolyase